MRINRPSVWMLALITLVAITCSAQAQQRLERFGNHDLILQPFGNWDLGPDFQWFSPTVNYEYGNEPLEANYGWYFTYDRLYWNVTRSNNAPNYFDGDFSWGNKFELGYMTEDDHGWLFTTEYLRGPNLDNFNKVHFASVEFNKTWRLEPTYRDWYFEPMVGVRYVKIDDYFNGYIENNIIGGNLGVRAHKQFKNFVVSGEFRVFPAWNYQFYEAQEEGLLLQEWVIGGEACAEVTYLFTRNVGIRFAWNVLYFGHGIGRGNVPEIENDEPMFMTGLNFGFIVNR